MANIAEFLDKKNIFAIVGASNNKEKYGNKVFLNLLDSGYDAIPINPSEDMVEGRKCYKNLKELSESKKIDIAILIVPAKITEQIVRECKELKISKAWMQPGSESDAAIRFCEENDIKVIHGMCMMVEKRHLR